ncbi:MAG: hypothetical protein ABJR02_02370, partial [Marinomonas sp.]
MRTPLAPICTHRSFPRETAHARGCALASKGMRATDTSAPVAAMQVPSTEIANPDSHHEGRSCNVPETGAPYSPLSAAATSGSRAAATRYPSKT